MSSDRRDERSETRRRLAELGVGEQPDFQVLTGHDLLTMTLPPRETILSPWLPSKGLAMIYGPRGIGKTHVSLGSAYAIASGGTFLRWQAAKPRRVLFLDGEMPAVTLKERLAAIARICQTEPPAPEFFRLLSIDLQERGLDLSDEADQRAIAADLETAEVIFCDNISTLARAGRENEAEVSGFRCRNGRWSSVGRGARWCSSIMRGRVARNAGPADGRTFLIPSLLYAGPRIISQTRVLGSRSISRRTEASMVTTPSRSRPLLAPAVGP